MSRLGVGTIAIRTWSVPHDFFFRPRSPWFIGSESWTNATPDDVQPGFTYHDGPYLFLSDLGV
jgi:hypothetical protein